MGHCREVAREYLSFGRGFGRRADVRVVCCWWVSMVVRFVCAVPGAFVRPRVPCVSCVSRLPPVSLNVKRHRGEPGHTRDTRDTVLDVCRAAVKHTNAVVTPRAKFSVEGRGQ